jgi:hypothetical protein
MYFPEFDAFPPESVFFPQFFPEFDAFPPHFDAFPLISVLCGRVPWLALASRGLFSFSVQCGREDSSTNATGGTSDCQEIKQVIVNFEQIYYFWTNETSDCEF